jgi:predicted methyltransferase MtxX (methanogen marker protein 4)
MVELARQRDADKEDLVDLARQTVMQSMKELACEEQKAESKAVKMRRAASRMKRKDGQPNVVAAVFEGEALASEQRAKQCGTSIKESEAVLALLKGYSYEADKKPADTIYSGATLIDMIVK